MSAIPAIRPVKRWASEAAPATAVDTHATLRQLYHLRTLAIIGQLAAVFIADRYFGVILPVGAMLAVIGGLAAYNAFTGLRLRDARPVGEREVLRQLSVDVVALTLMLSMSGGTQNPFCGIFLLPLALGAASLSGLGAWILAIGTVALYSVLLAVSSPISLREDSAEHLWVLNAGVWVSYAITAAVVAGMLVRIATALRSKERQITLAREKAASDEHILRIGVLAAGAAHELSSPLGSIATIIEDLRRRAPDDPEYRQDLDTAMSQVFRCRETLGTLLVHGRSSFELPTDPIPVDRLVHGCVGAFSVRRPDSRIVVRLESEGRAPPVLANQTLSQAITSLLDNAADVSPGEIEVALAWDAETIAMRISDRGPGFAPEVVERLGRLFFTTKSCGKGNGLGLYLANTTVLRFGGSMTLANADRGGAIVAIQLPVSRLAEAAFRP